MTTSGITVSIQAKIEGWQAELKRIQAQAAKIDIGSQLGKNLSDTISILEKQINSMSQNLTSRLTSDVSIDKFNDKLNDMERHFQDIGQALASVSLSDLNTEYIDNKIKVLTNDITKLKNELNSSMNKGFQSALTGATSLEKALTRINLDPKKLSFEEIKANLEMTVKSTTERIGELNAETEILKNNLKEVKQSKSDYDNMQLLKETDFGKVAGAIISKNAEDYGFGQIINEEALSRVKNKLEEQINKIKLSDEKKQQIREYLNDLVPESSVNIIRERMRQIQQELSGKSGLNDFGLGASNFNSYLDEIITQISDTSVLNNALDNIRQSFLNLGINKDDINSFMEPIRNALQNQDFSKAISIATTNLTKLQNVYQEKASQITKIVTELQKKISQNNSDVSKFNWTKTYAKEGLIEYENIIKNLQQQNKIKQERINQLEKQLSDTKDAVVRDIQTTGSTVKSGADSRLKENINDARTYKTELDQVRSREQLLGKMQGVVQRWFSVYAAVRMVNNAIRSIIATVQELDKTITNIAIVTDKTQSDLWKQMPQYTDIARRYAASISGTYEVSQLYYQQGLGQDDVLALTEETLKMARISGLNYADATDYMTNAVRSFKMEMQDASTVVDVYSSIAASSATSVTELASAMSKTASSAQAVGSSFENTTAMMAVMIEATRESAENIGSAMKSIISRYGEMTSDPSKLVDSEGEAISLNRVDKALQTVGISIHNASGEFRNFDEVIMELAKNWDTIDTNTQRYIATIMAGNRQQSRFLALVSSYDRLKELSAEAANSEDASQLQYLKTLDSIEAKTQQLQTSLQSLYINTGLEEAYKGILDLGNNIITSFSEMPRIFNLPIPAILKIGTTFYSVASSITAIFGLIKYRLTNKIKELSGETVSTTTQVENTETKILEQQIAERMALIERYYTYREQRAKGMSAKEAASFAVNSQKQNASILNQPQITQPTTQSKFFSKENFAKGTQGAAIAGLVSNLVGSAITLISSSLETATQGERTLKGLGTIAGGALQGAGLGFQFGGLKGALIGAAIGSLTSAFEGISIMIETSAERLKRLKDEATEANNLRIESTSKYNNLKSEVEQLRELEKTYNDSEEAKQSYYQVSNSLAESYPEIVEAYDAEGNAIIKLTAAYKALKEAQEDAHIDTTKANQKKIEAAEEEQSQAEANLVMADINHEINKFSNEDLAVQQKEFLINKDNEYYNELLTLFNTDKKTNFNDILKTIYTDELVADEDSFIYTIMQQLFSGGLRQDTLKNIFENQDNLTAFKNEVSNIQDNSQKEILNWFIASMTAISQEVLPEASELNKSSAKTKATHRAAINDETKFRIQEKQLESYYNNTSDSDYLSEFKSVGIIINDSIYKMYEEAVKTAQAAGKSVNITEWFNSEEINEAYTNLFNELSAVWNALNPEKQKELNKLIQERGNLTKDQFEVAIKDIVDITDPVSKEVYAWAQSLIDYYKDAFDYSKLQEALSKREELNSSNEDFNTIITQNEDSLKQLGDIELHKILTIYDGLYKRIANSSIRQSTGNEILSQYIKAFNGQDENVQSVLANLDIFSFNDINKAITELQSEDFDQDKVKPAIEALKNLSHLIPINLNTEVQSLISQFSNGLDNFEKSIKNATKGMNFKTMYEEAQKLGLEFSDFTLRDGKYYINDYLKLSQQLMEDQSSIFTSLVEDIDIRQAKALEAWQETSPSEMSYPDILNISEKEYAELAKEFANDVNKTTDNIIVYYYEKQKKQLEASAGEATTYANDMLARSALESGRLKDFAVLAMGIDENNQWIWDSIASDDQTAILNALASGDISTLTSDQQKYFEQYNSLLVSQYSNVQKSVASTLFAALNDGENTIKVTEANKNELEKLQEKGWIQSGSLDIGENAKIAIEMLEASEEDFMQYLMGTLTTEKDKLKAIKDRHSHKTENNLENTLEQIAGKQEFTYNDYIDYLGHQYKAAELTETKISELMQQQGLTLTASGKVAVEDINLWIADLQKTISTLPENTSSSEKNKLQAQLDAANNYLTSTLTSATTKLFQNYQSFSSSDLEEFATALGSDFDSIKSQIAIDNGDGTYRLNVAEIESLLRSKDISQTTRNALNMLLANISDSYISNIQKAGSLMISGTSSQTEIQNFKKAFKEIFPNEEPTFIYDALLNSWTLDINDAIRMIKESAKNITFGSEADRQAYIQNQIDNLFADNLDFSKFLAGTATEKENATLRSNLEKYYKTKLEGATSNLGISVSELVENSLATLSKGGAEAVKELQNIKDGKATSNELKAAYDAQIAPIRAAAEVIDSLQVGSFVATEQIETLRKAGFDIQDNVVVKTAENLTEAYQLLYDDMAASGEATIDELNKIATQALNNQYQYTQKRNLSDTLSKGTIGISDLIQLYTDQKIRFGTETNELDKNGNKIIDYSADLEKLVADGLINVDELGNVKITNFHGMAAKLGFEAGTEEYAAAYSKFVDSVISDRSNTSSERARTQLSNLISAKVGDAVNVADLPANIKTKLGIMGSDAIEIMSEAQRDNWILALDATEESDEAVKQAILEAQKSIKAKRNLSTNTAAVVAMKVSQSAAENLATALGQDTTEAARIMEERGYVFNEYTQEWKASTEVLKNLNRDLYIASQSGATAEDIANLEAAYNNLKYELQNQKYNAVQDIVNNYQNLSEESIAAFKTAFAKTKINITDYITTDEWGKNVVDLAALNQKLVEVGYDVNQLFQQEITSIGDAYLKNISTGVSLLSKGTNNLSDIGTFVESYNEVMGTNLTAGQVTYYDEVLKAFTIQPDFIREYIAKQGENLKAQGIIPEDRVDQWIQDNTVELARQNVDIKGFLSGERTQNDINKLGKALETYYEFAEKPFDEIQNLINNDIKGLQQGGAVAVNVAKSINPELTETDLAEIYSSAIKGWNEALSSAENLTIGQVVTGELRQVLSDLKMIDDANNVVTSVENMAGVYAAIFNQMSITAGNTLADLNKVYAKALEASESNQSRPVDIIKNATSMSYTQLGDYLTEYGLQLKDILNEADKYGIEALGGGKVRISDFTKFAREMGMETDTEEYLEAFKSYNDSIINYRNQTKTQMQSELQALSQMTTSGDVNITRIASQYHLERYLPTEDLERYGATLKDGILSLNESADIAGLTEKLGQLVIAEGGMTEDELNKLVNDIEVQAKLRDSSNKNKINTAAAYKDIFSNYNSLSIEMIGNLATQLGTTYEDIIDKLDLKNQQADGTYKVSLTKLRQVAKTAEGELQQQLLEQVADIENNILSSITSAGGFAREGTSSMSEMRKFINEYNTLTGENATLADSFIYDGALKAFTLTPEMLTKYIEAQKKQLEELGLSDEGAIEQYIKDQTENISRENINIESLLNAQGTAERNTAATELARQIQQLSNYSDIQKLIGKNVGATIDETMNAIYSVLSAGGDQAVELVKAIKGEKVTASDISTAYNAGIERLRTALNELEVHTGAIVSDYTAAILNAVGIETKDLENGTAVVTTLDENIKVDQLTQAYAALYNALKKNNEKTIADLNTAYAKILTSAESQEINAISTLQNAVSMTWEQLGEILTQEGKQLEEVFNDMAAYGVGSIGAGKVRIYDFTKFAEQMGWDPSSDEYISAYKAYNDGLIALNNQAEKAIVEEVKSLSSAKGGDWLNFTQLWATLQKATKTAIENIAPEDYTGNVDLAHRPIVSPETMKKVFKDFEGSYATLYSQTFMSENLGDLENSVGLLFTSITAAGEPVADLASYVKGLYEEAKGDVEKIRQLDARDRNLFLYGLQNTTAEEIDEYAIKLHDRGAAKDTIRYYNQALESYGARFVDGIFQLDSNANLFGVASTLHDLIDSGVIKIEDGLAEIEDAISDILKAYANAISKGIDGGLTNVEKQDLIQKASDLGLSDIKFEETAEGFKLVETSAIQLYYALKQIDSLQAGQIFDKLRESLEKTNENFKSSSALAAHITKISKGIYAADDKISQARKNQYQEELNIAKEILAVRATSEDSSFNFMSNSIPAAQNNPLNYFSNWASAIEKIKTAMKTATKDTKGKSHKGLIDYQDWYNIVTEMNNIAALGGEFKVAGVKLNGSMEAAAELIQKGANALVATKTGKLQVAMGDIGVEFKKGAGGMKQGIDDGIKAMAQSQIDMLDGMIQMLETIVAMEKLGDIAGDDDVIDIGDILPKIEWDENGNPVESTFEEFNKDYKSIVDYILDAAKNNEDLNKGLENLKINNKSIKEIFGMDASTLANMGKDFNEAYAAALQAIVTAARSGNYDENNVMQSLQEVFAESGLNNITLDTGKMVIVLSGGNISTVSWEDENVKSLLKKYTKNKITTAMQNFLSGTVTQQEIEIALTVKGVYKLNEKGEIKSIEWNGQQYDVNTEEFKKAQAAHLLKQLKVITDEKEFDLSKLAGKDGQYTTTYTIGEGQRNIHVNIKSDENGTETTFHSNITDKDYNSAQELFAEEYKYKLDELYWSKNPQADPYNDTYDNEKYAATKKEYTYDMYMWQINKIHANTKTVVETKDGSKTIDLNSQGSQGARNALLDVYNQSAEDFEKWAKDSKNVRVTETGDIEANVGDYKIVLNGKGIVQPDNKIDYSEYQAAIGKDLLGADLSLQENIAGGIVKGIESLSSSFGEAATTAGSLADAMERISSAAQMLQATQWGVIAEGIKSLNSPKEQQKNSSSSSDSQTTSTETTNVTTIVTKFEPDTKAVDDAKKEISEKPITITVDGDPTSAIETSERAKAIINTMQASINITASNSANNVITNIQNALNKLVNGGPYKVTVQASVSAGSKGNLGGGIIRNGAKESNLEHSANAKGTLMGELGPELVVSKGRYFVVGQNGPEMVDLDDDAIVFNHLQTQSLLTKGMSNGRGRAVTNERNAVSFATGNVDGGPAMASAAAALATLKQLRAMWESLLNASVSDIAGGGGGGGGGGKDKIVDPKAWVKTVERWYNLTQEIAKLEKDITHEETLRSKLQSDFSKNGTHYYNSQRLSLKALREQIAAQEQLNLSRQDYYTKRIDALKNEPLGKLYTFDEQGQMHFRDDVTMNGQKGAMNFLTDLMGFDENGKANYTNEQKYNILKQYGFDEYMKYNSNGEQILLDADHSGDVTDEERETYYQQATEAWRDRMDNFASETQSLWDSIQEGENNLLELQANQNELLQEMRDNQIAVEEDVLKAIEDMRQREIDALQDERDKLEDSTGKYIEGLSDALSKEQEMYDNQQQENDLNQQRRRLAILQRSGGSAADIANLQNEINSNERSRYFDLQQQQIDAIQQASDLQLERMDNQIELMTETLEYQKEYGLLWSEVYDVMSHSAAQITSFIMNGNSEFWAKSPLGSATSANDTLFKADQWVGFREDMTDITTDVANLAFAANEQKKANDYKIYDSAMKKEFGSNYDSKGKYKGIFEQVYDETGDITKASAAARAEYQKDKKAEEDKKKAEEAKKPKTTSTSTSTSTPSTNNSSNNNSNNNNKKSETKMKATIKYYTGSGASGTAVGYGIGTTESSASATAYKYALSKVPKNAFNMDPAIYTKMYKAGGMNRETGPAWLDGTKEKPEAVFNADQTKILRDNILSNKPNSLITLLNTYNEAYKDGISVAPQEASGQLIIENATVNMNVEQIANDYDARRAGEQALNEMMRIARKTGAANSIRR